MASNRSDDWNARGYAAHSTAQAVWAAELLERLDLKLHESVVDLGCGHGAVTAEMARRVRKGFACGVDSSRDMVAHARTTYPSSKFPNLDFRQQDIRFLSLDEKFDVAFSSAVLHWVDDQPAVLGSLSACLNPGARVYFSCGGRGNARDVVRAVEEITGDPARSAAFEDFVFPYHFHDVVGYHRWLEEAGYSIARVDLVHKDMVHESPEAFRAWLRTTWHPYLDRLRETEREPFTRAVAARYLQKHPTDSKGRTHVAMVRLEVEATWT